MMGFLSVIAYCSPAGSTRHVAQVIERTLRRAGEDVLVHDLGKEHDWTPALAAVRAYREVCLYLGSPVYVGLAVPPVMQFIEVLPSMSKGYVVPFVTWGAVSSGVALWQMADALAQKKATILGGLSVPAVHSMMWSVSEPLGQGRPDAQDDEIVAEGVRSWVERLRVGQVRPSSPEALDVQPAIRAEKIKTKIGRTSQAFPRRINQTLCIQCSLCTDMCPAEAIVLDPYPTYDERCFGCGNCVRYCPAGAIEHPRDWEMLAGNLRRRAERMGEAVVTRVFGGGDPS